MLLTVKVHFRDKLIFVAVRRYRNREILSGNFLNVSFDSVKKAAELAKSRLSRATSIGMADEEEKKFIDLEKK